MSVLPASAQAKLRALQRSSEDADALARTALARRQHLEGDIVVLRQSAGARPQEAEKIAAEIGRLEAEVEAAEEVRRRRQDRASNDRQLAAQLRHWIDQLPRGAKLVAVPPVDVDDQGRDDVHEGLASLREQIGALQRRLRKLRATPLPLDELRALARDYVAGLADEARPTLTGLHGGAPFGLELGPNGSGLVALAWLAPELLLARIEDMLPADAGDPGRAEAIATAETDLLDLERAEEALIVRALEQGQDAFRRPRADPRAVLGVDVARRERRVA